MVSCSNQKSVKQIKIYFKCEILQIATLCLDDSLAFSPQLHEVVIWNAFQLTDVLLKSPYYGKNSSNRQREMTFHTLRHERQSIWNISRTLNISSSGVAKTIECYMMILDLRGTTAGMED
jgi:hypothetical protein